MHLRVLRPAIVLLLEVVAAQASQAADDSSAARVREMLHRTQEALRQAQSDNADLARGKTEAEEKLAAATKQLEAARGESKAELALKGQLKATQASQDDLTRKLADTSDRLAAANSKLGETAKQLAARESELKQAQEGLQLSKTADASCEDKNLKLYSYSQELLQAYRKKGVWDSLSQKDPVLGLKNVEIENVVQEYQVKLSNEKIQSPAR